MKTLIENDNQRLLEFYEQQGVELCWEISRYGSSLQYAISKDAIDSFIFLSKKEHPEHLLYDASAVDYEGYGNASPDRGLEILRYLLKTHHYSERVLLQALNLASESERKTELISSYL